jgi:hypothetical protein
VLAAQTKDADDPEVPAVNKSPDDVSNSPTSPQPPVTSTVAGSYDAMTLKGLRSAAVGMGLDDEAIEEARDADDPKAALIALINTHTNSRQPTAADTDSLVANAPGYIAVASKSTTSSSAVQAP